MLRDRATETLAFAGHFRQNLPATQHEESHAVKGQELMWVDEFDGPKAGMGPL